MAIIGIDLDKTNPAYSLEDFLFWFPQYANVFKDDKNSKQFNNIKEIANNRIFKSIFGTDWIYAMGLCIAHYLELIAINSRIGQAENLKDVAGGQSYRGTMSSMSVGSFSKTIELGSTLIEGQDSSFWNQTSHGASLMALYKTKAVPSIFVVTSN